MDDNAKNASSYHLDQEVLDARGINMTVEEVAGLPTTKYSERVQALRLSAGDLAFLKGLRRRIKNRLASQNSRRRSMEQLRRLTRELRAVRACRDDALADRAILTRQRDEAREKCRRLRDHLIQTLRERFDMSEVPQIDVEITESQIKSEPKEEKDTPPLTPECDIERDKNVFECRIDKLVQKSVNHIFNKNDKKKIFAKTVFISDVKEEFSTVKNTSNIKLKSNGNLESSIVKMQRSNVKLDSPIVKYTSSDGKLDSSDVKYHSSSVKSVVFDGGLNGVLQEDSMGVLNLSVKEGRRKSHGRKQSAPRRITYVEYEVAPDDVLDLKIKK
ncbi:hypothetical protein ABMA28_012654 [Loxostege sticticalis]|uniref:BZIP domain-containing protein n=1 Tax=Loxostege sticticalis TaxID=481309 RepID=A0ABD0S4P6_LOXSC